MCSIRGQSTVALFLAVFAAAPTMSLAQMSQRELREYTERSLKLGTVAIEKPVFTATRDRTGTVYPFSLGGVKETSFRSTFSGSGLLAIPLQEQFRVTVIRAFRNSPSKRHWWAPRLAAVEREIQLILNALDLPSYEATWEEMALHSGHINQIYNQAMIDAGIIEPGEHPKEVCYTCAGAYMVRIHTTPADGLVKYIPAGDWDLYWFRTAVKGHTNVPKPDWITVEQNSIELGGKYWFSVSWSGKVRYKNLIHVRDDNPLFLSPEQ
jgi:hypothetical protein